MNVGRVMYSLCGASLLFFNASAHASGKVKTATGVYNYVLNFADQNAANTIGTEIEKKWDVGPIPSGQWYIQCTSVDDPYASGVPVFYTANYVSPLPNTTGHWYSLDEHWDVSVQIYISGGIKGYVYAPFDKLDNKYLNAPASCRRLGDNYPKTSNLATGKQGIFSLKLKKKIVNGYSFVSSPILYIAGATAANEIDVNDPFARIVIDSFAINLPEKCEINAGQSIDIDFGDVATTKLDGSHYPVRKTLTVSCSGGEFESGLSSVATSFVGGVSTFSNDYFATTHRGIGILLKDEANHVIKPKEEKKINIMSGKGSLPVIFSPVASSKNIDAGEFSASIVVKLLLE